MDDALVQSWDPKLAGMTATVREGGIVQLESDRIFFDEATERAALAIPGGQGTLTYLVNTIKNDAHMTPYSFMTAGGALTSDLKDDEIIINEWLAGQLATREGERLAITYYEVLPSNKFEERSREFTIKRIAVSYTHLRAPGTVLELVCRLLLEKKKGGEIGRYIHGEGHKLEEQ